MPSSGRPAVLLASFERLVHLAMCCCVVCFSLDGTESPPCWLVVVVVVVVGVMARLVLLLCAPCVGCTGMAWDDAGGACQHNVCQLGKTRQSVALQQSFDTVLGTPHCMACSRGPNNNKPLLLPVLKVVMHGGIASVWRRSGGESHCKWMLTEQAVVVRAVPHGVCACMCMVCVCVFACLRLLSLLLDLFRLRACPIQRPCALLCGADCCPDLLTLFLYVCAR